MSYLFNSVAEAVGAIDEKANDWEDWLFSRGAAANDNAPNFATGLQLDSVSGVQVLVGGAGGDAFLFQTRQCPRDDHRLQTQ